MIKTSSGINSNYNRPAACAQGFIKSWTNIAGKVGSRTQVKIASAHSFWAKKLYEKDRTVKPAPNGIIKEVSFVFVQYWEEDKKLKYLFKRYQTKWGLLIAAEIPGTSFILLLLTTVFFAFCLELIFINKTFTQIIMLLQVIQKSCAATGKEE